MKSYKNLSVCNALLKGLQSLNETKPETVSQLETARRKLNRLKRSQVVSREELFEAVRHIAEAVLKSTNGRK